MCCCEHDVVNAMIQVAARRHYPGLRYHQATLSRVAREFGITNSMQLRHMDADRLHALATAVLNALPGDARPADSATAA